MQEKVKKLREYKLLFVEDEEDLVVIIKETLQKLQCNFITAKNGKEALEILDKNSDIDVVVTDLNMPLMSGLELIKTISKKNLDLHIVVMSAHTEEKYIEQAKELGVENYMQKPFDFLDFINLIICLEKRKCL